MAKKNDTLRIEIIDQDIARSLEILEGLRAEYAKLGQGITTEVEKIKKLEAQRAQIVPQTLAEALVTYTKTGENSEGYKALQERTYKGDWKDTGFGMFGEYWVETNQRCLSLRLDRTWDDERLAKLIPIIEEVMPAILPGAAVDKYDKDAPLKLTSKGASADPKTIKVLQIRTCGYETNWMLGLMADGDWVVFDQRNMRYNRARLTGTLMECLQDARTHLAAEGWPETSDEDEELY